MQYLAGFDEGGRGVTKIALGLAQVVLQHQEACLGGGDLAGAFGVRGKGVGFSLTVSKNPMSPPCVASGQARTLLASVCRMERFASRPAAGDQQQDEQAGDHGDDEDEGQ